MFILKKGIVMARKILITGATGFIGKKIVNELITRGDKVVVLSRSNSKTKNVFHNAHAFYEWDMPEEKLAAEFSDIDAVIHLAGEGVMNKRWSVNQKKKILESRVNSTIKLGSIFSKAENKPDVFISASAVGYYGNSELEADENSQKGDGFLADVVDAWENETSFTEKLKIRRVNIRIGIVLDKNEGALAKMITPFKLFVGGPLGNGKQWMPWIHINDLIKIFIYALDNENVNGIVNGVSPNPVNMKMFAKTLGTVMNRPSFFKVPSFVLNIILGEAAQTVLTGAKVYPRKLLGMNFEFEYNDIESALRDILKK